MKLFYYSIISSVVLIASVLTACNFGGGNRVLVSRQGSQYFNSGGRGSSSGTEACKDSGDCEGACYEIYVDESKKSTGGEADAVKCAELSFNTVKDFYEVIMDSLERSDELPLSQINSRTFSQFLEISRGPWAKTTDEISDDERENILIWIARNAEIATAIISNQKPEREIEDYEGMKNLFKNKKYCSRDLGETSNFYEIACLSNNAQNGAALLNAVGCSEPQHVLQKQSRAQRS